MRKIRYRRARTHDSARTRAGKRHGLSIRLVASVIAFALFALASVPAAQASTGGASGFTPTEPPVGGEVAFSPFRVAGASWYGPGLYGHKTACGATLRPTTLGVAHRSLPCGTTVKFVHRGHALITQVIDRGPYIQGRAWDLTQAASEALAFESVGVGRLRYAVALEYARGGSGR
ncbi:MAG: septal ring lytic transglycosylase RlpA family protein [Solirubrobacterales bacterium]